MTAATDHLRVLDDMLTQAIDSGILHQTAQDSALDGRTLRINGRDLVNFSSCSYLGLERDPRVIAGVIDAVQRYGSQFSSSRAYVSAPAYAELEADLFTLFGAPTVVAPSTTLAHFAALPVLVEPSDALLLDHHVHNSVQMTSTIVGASGAKVEVIRHHDLAQLEDRILALGRTHKKIWFMVDGLCSMFGDLAPMAEFRALLDRHDNLRLYVDDAHGMSWCGENGRGYALSDAPIHPHMVVTTSLNKAFGAGGGVIILPNAELCRRVRTCGATLIFSGPIQPPMLGAALASAGLHLSPEFKKRQEKFAQHSAACHDMIVESGLPSRSDPCSPVQYIEVGPTSAAQKLVKLLMNDGYYANIAQFPAVPIKRAGIRFTLTLHQDREDVRGFVDSLTKNHALVTHDPTATAGVPPQFSIGKRTSTSSGSKISRTPCRAKVQNYRVVRATTIRQIPAQEWNAMLGDRGCFSTQALALLERTFCDPTDPVNRWGFHYYRVVDEEGVTRLATFFTDALWKADMMAPACVSEAVEQQRVNDPLHLTHRVFAMGSLLTEGNHLYVDPSLGVLGSLESKRALSVLLAAVQKDATEAMCETIALRDFDEPDTDFENYLRDEGFLVAPMSESFEVSVTWRNQAEFLSSLSRGSRRHQRYSVRPYDNQYRVEIFSRNERNATPEELDHFYALYLNVKKKSLELNTFDLPKELFDEVMRDERWEILALYDVDLSSTCLPVGMAICFKGDTHSVPLVAGLDYTCVQSKGLYRQCLRHVIDRSIKLGLNRICLGLGTSLEKQRFGARGSRRVLFVQTRDHYVFDALAQMAIDQHDNNG